MGDAAVSQSSFLGGEWSRSFQGRIDHPKYRTAMNVCLNSVPLEEGAVTRRSGTHFAATTRAGNPGRVIPFTFQQTAPYLMEITDSHLRFYLGNQLVFDTTAAVLSISSANPAVVTVDALPDTWAEGDMVQFVQSDNLSAIQANILLNRQFAIRVISGETFTVIDPISGTPLDGSLITGSPSLTVGHILDIGTPWSGGDWDTLRAVQSENAAGQMTAVMLQAAAAPQVLTALSEPIPAAPPVGNIAATFSFLPAQFEDGPYLDPVPYGAQLTPSGASGSTDWTEANCSLLTTSAIICVGFPGYSTGDRVYAITNPTAALASLPVPLGATVTGTGIQAGTVTIGAPYLAYVDFPASLIGDTGKAYSQQFVVVPVSLAPTTSQFNGQSITFTTTFSGPSSTSLSLNYVPWSADVVYDVGELVSYSDAVYKSLLLGNVNYEPDTNPTYWASVGAGAAIGPSGFTAGDVGRLVRLFSEPAQFSSVTAYTAGETVSIPATSAYGAANEYYTALVATTGTVPGTNPAVWGLAPEAAVWTWGTIISITSAVEVVVFLAGGALAYDTVIDIWQLGVYANSTSWPTCGCYHQGRLWLGGALPNRFDASSSNDIFNFSPTGPDGTVADSNAISAVFDATDANVVYWMQPTAAGIIAGTLAGEWLIQASALNDPLTPSSVQAHRVTRYGCANVEPRATPLALVFVQAFERKIMEFFPDVFSGHYVAPDLTETAHHLTKSSVVELAYQREIVSIIWARGCDGTLFGGTYRRMSSFATEAPNFIGWHRHTLGSGRIVESICVGPSAAGTLDALAMVTNQTTVGSPDYNVRHVEILSNFWQEDDIVQTAWFVDDGAVPNIGALVGGPPATSVTLYGLWHLNGKSVAATVAGIDCGQVAVVNGTASIPFAGAFTLDLLEAFITPDQYGYFTPQIDLLEINHVAPELGAYTLQSFVGSDANVTGVSGDDAVADFARYGIYTVKEGDATHDGARWVSMLNGGVNLEAEFSTIANGESGGMGLAYPYSLGGDGNIYSASDLSNNTVLWKIDPFTLVRSASFGTAGNGFLADASHLCLPSSMAVIVAGGVNYMFMPALVAGKPGTLLDTDTMTWANFTFTPDEDRAYACAGAPGFAWALASDVDGGATTTPLGLYRIEVTAAGVGITTKVGTIAPSAVDPTWTHFAVVQGPCYDAINNDVVFIAQTIDSVTNKQYLVRVSGSNADVIYVLALAGIVTGSLSAFPKSTMPNGIVAFMIDDVLNVADVYGGLLTTFTIPGLVATGGQIFDGYSGQLILYGEFAQTTGSPNLLNSTPTTFTDWCSLSITYGGSTIVAPTTVCPDLGENFINVGFTYTSQGQVVRPALPTEGGASNGALTGKTRRLHMFSALLVDTQGISFGTDFTALHAALFKSPGGTPYTQQTLYSGVYQGTIESKYDFDGMLCWQITRPYPATVAAVNSFVMTQDR